MTFLYFVSPAYRTRADILKASIKKFHCMSTIVEVACETPEPGKMYPNGVALQKMIKVKELLSEGHEKVISIGADCELFSALQEVEEFNDSVLLVPHAVRPVKDRSYMCQIYRTGHANGDFVVFNNTPETMLIIDWLISVVRSEDNKEDGSFYEQTWLSSLPFLYRGVGILRHSGYNVAYWDIRERGMQIVDGQWQAGSEALRFMHYSGFDEKRPDIISRHALDFKTDCPNISRLYDEYRKKLTKIPNETTE